MVLDLIKAWLPAYFTVNMVLLVLLLLTFPMVDPGTDSYYIANITTVFVSAQVVISGLGIYFFLDYGHDEVPNDEHV